jgi:hypothetical protein
MRNLIITIVIACFSIPLFVSTDADAAFGRRKPVYNVENVSFSTSSGTEVTLEQVGEAVEKAIRNRGWNFSPVSNTTIEASILVRSRHKAIVDISYTTSTFSIQYKDSDVLLYEKEDGKIHRNYNKWVILLEREIQDQLNRL